MGSDIVVNLIRDALWIGLLISAPILGVAMLVGLIVGLAQAVTSIHEQTLAFVPKIVGIAAVVVLMGGWMVQKLVSYTYDLFAGLPQYGAM
jgi:flagellar biosynthetic protein FliQ